MVAVPLLARLEKTLQVSQLTEGRDNEAKATMTWANIGTLCGIVGSASPGQAERYNQLGQQVSHTVVQRGAPYAGAKPGDRLSIVGDPLARYFLVRALENPAEQGSGQGAFHGYTIFFCEERRDLT